MPEQYIDVYGYPIMGFLPDLYTYLWNTYNIFFTPEGYWATNKETVMSTLGELWTHAEWRDRIIAKEQKEIDDWEREMKEWEEENMEDEEGLSIDDMDNFGKGKKSKKNKKKKDKGKRPPPPPPKNLSSYKRFEKPASAVAVPKKNTGFKEVSEITFEEEVVEVDETRQPSSLVFIGHVDAGKSTI